MNYYSPPGPATEQYTRGQVAIVIDGYTGQRKYRVTVLQDEGEVVEIEYDNGHRGAVGKFHLRPA
jgi:hypothetical protein